MPDPQKIRENKQLRCFGHLLRKPALWHLNRHSVAAAFGLGLFFAFIPVPFQMLLAAAGAIVFNANMPLSVGTVWITNPLTMPPLFYAAYVVGGWILGVPPAETSIFDSFTLSWEWLGSSLNSIWKPFLTGCLILGMVSGVVGYVATQVAWRVAVLRRWRRRHASRAF